VPEVCTKDTVSTNVKSILKTQVNIDLAAESKDLCYMHGQWYVEDESQYWPTCVAADTSGCSDTDLVCGTALGDENTQASRIYAAIKRNDYKHADCPSLETTCKSMPQWMWENIKDALLALYGCTDISNGDLLETLKENVCYGKNDYIVRYVEKTAGLIHTCTSIRFDYPSPQHVCPHDRDYLCAGMEFGMDTFGWPDNQALLIARGLMQDTKVHPTCPFGGR
jgi:hypothetical protein